MMMPESQRLVPSTSCFLSLLPYGAMMMMMTRNLIVYNELLIILGLSHDGLTGELGEEVNWFIFLSATV
jgi:hypothetical protein